MNYLPIFAIGVSIIGLLFQHFFCIAKIQERLAALETKTDLFWKGVEHMVIPMLKSFPTDIGKDVLLDKMLHNELTLADAQTLRLILTEEFTGNGDKSLIYILALGRLEQIIFDKLERKPPERTCK